MAEDPNSVRAVIERQIEYLGQQIHRIDDDHAGIRAQLEGMTRTLNDLDKHLRTLIEDPARLEKHWKFGQGVFRVEWLDATARAVGNRVLTFLFAAILAGLVAWAALRGK